MKPLKHLQWRLEFLAYRGVERLLAWLSPSAVDLIGRSVGTIGYHIMGSRRAIVTHNLRIAYSDHLSPGEINSLVRQVFARSGANLFGSIRTASLSPEEIEQLVSCPNMEELNRLAARDKGVILLIPHMGNWEVLAQISEMLPAGHKLATHYRKLHNPYLNAVIEKQRSRSEVQLFPKTTSPHTMTGLLREGGILGILTDQRAGTSGYWCSYYGRFATCSPLPELFARRTGAAIACLSVRTTKPGHWTVAVTPLEDTSTPACMEAMEQVTRRSPSDVFWFQERWRIKRRAPFLPEGKPHRKADPRTSTKPIRLLIWLSSGQSSLPALPDGHRPDLQLDLAYPEGTKAPNYPQLPWSRTWPIDQSLQPEHFTRVLRTIDEAHPLPLSGVLLTAPNPEIQRAAARTHLAICHCPNQETDHAT